MIDANDIIRLRTGFAMVPGAAGSGRTSERLMMCAYVIRHPKGVFLFDTGIGSHPTVDDLYSMVRWDIDDQLAANGLARSDIVAVANCHLHFDHAGGNGRFPGIPIIAQRIEHETALAIEDYTIPGIADFPGARYELLEGEAPIWPGLMVLPTPGHTAGHQSLLVETRQGRVVLAGQSFNLASDYARARLSQELDQAGYGDDEGYPEWMDVVNELDPWRILFAHDVAMWERGPTIPSRA
jgi:glyoxylase-like metal-dependent hydrolase (beta-lactamase superfamily II)